MHHIVCCRIQKEKWQKGKSPNRLEKKCMTVNKKKEKGEYEEQISTLILKICLSLTNEKKDEQITDGTN